jgi:hypothetical protein
MQNAEDARASARLDDPDDSYQSIVSDLVSLIGHVQSSIKLIESAIAIEPPCRRQELVSNVVVLDDVTPRYQNVTAALNACNRSLEVTLHRLLDVEGPKRGIDDPAACDIRSARSLGRR